MGRVSNLPVAQLLGGAKQRCQAYFNTAGKTAEDLIRSGEEALKKGYTALKDHLPFSPKENERVFRLIRESVGEQGWVTCPGDSPGWGAEWDWSQFEKRRIAVL